MDSSAASVVIARATLTACSAPDEVTNTTDDGEATQAYDGHTKGVVGTKGR